MAIRRMNYTKRVNLHKQHVKVTLGPDLGNGARSFTLDLDLPENLPAAALLALEAYHSSPPIRMRSTSGPWVSRDCQHRTKRS